MPAPATDAVAPDAVQAVASVQSARTEAIVAVVDEIAEIVVREIELSPTLAAGGNGEMTIRLKPTVLDGSEIKFSVAGESLSLVIAPATAQAAAAISGNINQLEAALAAHAPAFRQVTVAVAANESTVRKVRRDETK